jgi:hypothetical protein
MGPRPSSAVPHARIAYAFGVEPLQQYLIEFPGGRLQTLAYTWDTRSETELGNPDALIRIAALRQLRSLPSELRLRLPGARLLNDPVQVLRGAYDQFDGNFDIAMALATMLRDSGNQDGALDIAYTLARRHPEDQNVVALLR